MTVIRNNESNDGFGIKGVIKYSNAEILLILPNFTMFPINAPDSKNTLSFCKQYDF